MIPIATWTYRVVIFFVLAGVLLAGLSAVGVVTVNPQELKNLEASGNFTVQAADPNTTKFQFSSNFNRIEWSDTGGDIYLEQGHKKDMIALFHADAKQSFLTERAPDVTGPVAVPVGAAKNQYQKFNEVNEFKACLYNGNRMMAFSEFQCVKFSLPPHLLPT